MDCTEATRRVLDSGPGKEPEALLVRHLESCADCSELARRHAAMARAADELRLRAHPRVWAGIERAIRPRPSLWSWMERAVEGLLARPAWSALGTVAALALLFLYMGWTGPDPLSYQASGSVLASGTGALGGSGRLVPRAQELTVEAGATLRLSPRPGESIEIAGPARLRPRSARHLELAVGRVRVEVEPGQGGLTLDVPQGQIVVVGTVFTVELGPAGALVTLMRGKLELRPREGPAGLLRSGEIARLTPAGLERLEPQAVPPPSSPDTVRAAPPQEEPRTATAVTPPASEPPPRPAVSSTRPGGKASGGF